MPREDNYPETAGLSTPAQARCSQCSFESRSINHPRLFILLIIATAESSEVPEKLIC